MFGFIIGAIVLFFVASSVYWYYDLKEKHLKDDEGNQLYDENGKPITYDASCVQGAIFSGAGTTREVLSSIYNEGRVAYAKTKTQTRIAKTNLDAAGETMKDGWDESVAKCKAKKADADARIAKIEAEGEIKIAEAAKGAQALREAIAVAKARAVQKQQA